MAQTIFINPHELERIAVAAYVGKTINVLLCNNSGYDGDDTVDTWESVELSGGGYSRYTTTIATGNYDAINQWYSLPSIVAEFNASSTGAGLSFDTVVIYFSGETYIHSHISQSPSVTIQPGASLTFEFNLITDD
jgi:hypothetical protein